MQIMHEQIWSKTWGGATFISMSGILLSVVAFVGLILISPLFLRELWLEKRNRN